jgi:hypothetical protein
LKRDGMMVFAAYPRDLYQVTMATKQPRPPLDPPAHLFVNVANEAYIMYKRLGASTGTGTGKRKRTSSGGKRKSTSTKKRRNSKNKRTKKRTHKTRR